MRQIHRQKKPDENGVYAIKSVYEVLQDNVKGENSFGV